MEIDDLILEGKALLNISDSDELKNRYHVWCGKVKICLKEIGFSEKVQEDVKLNMHYTDNEYSEVDTIRSLKKTLEATIQVLVENINLSENMLAGEKELLLIERILNNFYMYYRAMYREPVHKRGSLKTEILNAIQIGNEYDLQRMLYSILLPVFPTLRQEVYNDNGYGAMRADLYLDTYDLIIETKCTRDSMSEKQLVDELGADGFHYRASVIFFFVWDKIGIIKNEEAFKTAFEREQKTDGKMVKVFILRSREL